MKKKTTQLGMIRHWLVVGNKITALQAMKKPFNCINLSGRISDLRKMGFKIQAPMILQKSGKRIAEYQIKKRFQHNIVT